MRFGMFGTGYWAAEVHAAAIDAVPDAELVGVWGRDPAKAATVAERYQARAYPNVDGLLSDVDAVAIALPPQIQADIAVRAAEAGRHLFLDKPLALTTEAADRVVAAVDHSGVSSVVFFTNRFYDNIERFLRETAGTGGWDGARATMFASIFQPGNPFGGSPWRREKGGLWDIGPHALSVILPVLGPVAGVTALTGPHDTAHVLLRHDSGAVSALALTLDAPPAAGTHEFVFYGEAGFVTVPGGSGTSLEAAISGIGGLITTVRGAPPHPCDARFGRDVVAVLEAAETARQTGTIQLLPGS